MLCLWSFQLTPNSMPAYFSRISGSKIPRAPSMAHLAWITSTVLYLQSCTKKYAICRRLMQVLEIG